jgi:Cu(I)/Ag(I) efflux system membrane protein CusA/SilA
VGKISFSGGPAMIRDEDGELTGYVYLDLDTKDYGGFVELASRQLRAKLSLPVGFSYRWSGEYEFELRAKQTLKIILPVVFFVIFLLLYMVFDSVTETLVLIFPTFYAMTGGLILQWLLGYELSVAAWVGYIALFGIAVETGVVMVVYLHEALDQRLAGGAPLRHEDIQDAVIAGAVQRLRPKLMTVTAVLASLIPILWESGIGADVMKPIAAPIVGGMITSTIHVLILVPVSAEAAMARGGRRLPRWRLRPLSSSSRRRPGHRWPSQPSNGPTARLQSGHPSGSRSVSCHPELRRMGDRCNRGSRARRRRRPRSTRLPWSTSSPSS